MVAYCGKELYLPWCGRMTSQIRPQIGEELAMQDVITRDIVVKAPKERVFKALTDPKEIVIWFPDSVEGGTLEVGQEPIFSFESGTHRRRVHIEASNPYDYFAYRWIPGPSGAGVDDVLSIPNTLVEFSIEETDGGTKITVKESGFASLPIEEAESSFNDNSGGWPYMLERLEKLLSGN